MWLDTTTLRWKNLLFQVWIVGQGEIVMVLLQQAEADDGLRTKSNNREISDQRI